MKKISIDNTFNYIHLLHNCFGMPGDQLPAIQNPAIFSSTADMDNQQSNLVDLDQGNRHELPQARDNSTLSNKKSNLIKQEALRHRTPTRSTDFILR